MKISYDKWYPIVQPQTSVQTEAFAKRVERLDAERALNTQIAQQVKKFHQYEYEIYESQVRSQVEEGNYGKIPVYPFSFFP